MDLSLPLLVHIFYYFSPLHCHSPTSCPRIMDNPREHSRIGCARRALPSSHLGKRHVNQLTPPSREEALSHQLIIKVLRARRDHTGSSCPAPYLQEERPSSCCIDEATVTAKASSWGKCYIGLHVCWIHLLPESVIALGFVQGPHLLIPSEPT